MNEKYISVTKFKESLAKLTVEGGTEATRETIARTLGEVVPQLLDDEPSADVQLVKCGWWDYSEKENGECAWYFCSLCDEPAEQLYNDEPLLSEFCPHCGARMDGDTSE